MTCDLFLNLLTYLSLSHGKRGPCGKLCLWRRGLRRLDSAAQGRNVTIGAQTPKAPRSCAHPSKEPSHCTAWLHTLHVVTRGRRPPADCGGRPIYPHARQAALPVDERENSFGPCDQKNGKSSASCGGPGEAFRGCAGRCAAAERAHAPLPRNTWETHGRAEVLVSHSMRHSDIGR